MPRTETRAHLQETALALIAEKGYDNVTVDRIAEEAGVSHMTFFRYFPTKESVVVADPYDPVIAEAVARQSVDLPALERVRRGLVEVSNALDDLGDETTRLRIRIGIGHRRLRAAMWQNTHETEGLLVGVLTGSGVDRLEAGVVVGACLGALMAALVDWAVEDSGESLGGRVRRALDYLVVG